MSPQITIDVTDEQLASLDNHNAALNEKLKKGDEPHSRQTFAAAALEAPLATVVAAAAKAKAKEDKAESKDK